MRHKIKGRTLGRKPAHRRMLLRNLVTDLIERERIESTDGRVKEMRPLAEKMITLGKRGTLHARRQAAAVLTRPDVVKKLFGPVAEKFMERPGGYTRITKIGMRKGDMAPISVIELVQEEMRVAKKKPRRRRSSAKKASEKAAGKKETAASKEKAPKADKEQTKKESKSD